MENKESVVVVGIGGVTNGGKTTLANDLADFLKNKKCNTCVIHQDDYFKSENEVPWDDVGNFGRWDELVAFHMDKMIQDIKFRIERFNECPGTSVLIIEGILIFNHKTLNSLFDTRYVLTLMKDEAIKRRLTRTYDPPDTANLFEDHVWPMYLKHLELIREENIPVTELDGSLPQDVTFERVKTKLLSLLAER